MISPPGPDHGVKSPIDHGDRSKASLLVFERRHMDDISTIEQKPRIPKVKAVFFKVLMPFCFIPFNHSTL